MRLRGPLPWPNGIVPVTVEAPGTQAYLRHLLVRDLPALGVLALVDLGPNAQPRLGRGRSDEVHDSHQAGQRPATPVGTDVREQPVFDLVPLAGARGEMADRDGKPRGVGQPLELPLPQADLGPVAPAAVGRDEQRLGPRVDRLAHRPPPSPDSPHGETGRVVVDADAHPARVAGEVVHPVGDGLAVLLDDEVVNLDRLGAAFGPPLSAGILEVADEFLLLGVHGDDRLPLALKRQDRSVDVPKLRIPVRVAATFLGLLVALQCVPGVPQNVCQGAEANVMSHGAELCAQLADALGSPQQGVFGIAGHGWFDETINIPQESRVCFTDLLATPAWPANPTQGKDFARLHVLHSTPNGESGNTCSLRNQSHAAPSYVNGFCGTPHPPTPFCQGRGQCLILRSNPFEVHALVYRSSDENVAVISARCLRGPRSPQPASGPVDLECVP